MKLADLLVDDLTWSCATRPRRAEWVSAIEELMEEAAEAGEAGADGFSGLHPGPAASTLRAYVTVASEYIRTVFHDPRGAQVGRIELPRPIIAPVFREYMRLLLAMGERGAAGYSPQVEALDIARRLMHNDAADLIIQHAAGVHPDHKTARRLFTLFVLLTHDTTKLRAAWV